MYFEAMYNAVCSGGTCTSRCIVVCPDVCPVPTSFAPSHDGRRPARCTCGRVHSCANIDSPTGTSVQKCNSPQGGQVHYTNDRRQLAI